MKVFEVGKDINYRTWQWYASHILSSNRSVCMVASRQIGKTQLLSNKLSNFMFLYDKQWPYSLNTMQSHRQAFKILFGRMHRMLHHLPKSIYSVRGGSGNEAITARLVRPWRDDEVELCFSGVGNSKGIRGDAIDNGNFDEISIYPQNIWYEVFRPMFNSTRGRRVISGTVQGKHNVLYEQFKLHLKLGSEGKSFGAIYLPDRHCGFWNEESVWELEKEYRLAGKAYLHAQEMRCDWNAVPEGVFAFAEQLNEIERIGHYLDSETFDESVGGDRSYVNVAIDIGLKEHLCAWVFSQMDGVLYLHRFYKGNYNLAHLEHLAAQIYSEFNDYHQINFYLPFDATQGSQVDGVNSYERLNSYLDRNDYSHKIKTHVLGQVRPNTKKFLYADAIRLINDPNLVKVNFDYCDEGIDLLSSAKWRVDSASDLIRIGDLARGKYEHCVDAFCYMGAAITNRLTPADPYEVYDETSYYRGPTNYQKKVNAVYGKYTGQRFQMTDFYKGVKAYGG